MNFSQFEKSTAITILNNAPIASFSTDREGKIVWISRDFTNISGYELKDIQGKEFRTLLEIILENTIATKIRCRIIPNPRISENTLAVFTSNIRPSREGVHVQIDRLGDFDGFFMYSAIALPYTIERILLFYVKELFAIMDDQYRIEEFGDRFYKKLLQIFGKIKFRGVNLKECLVAGDFKAWEQARQEFLMYVRAQSEKNVPEWELFFDSSRDGFSRLFDTRHASWNIRDLNVALEAPEYMEGYFLVSNTTFDFFTKDFKVEYRISSNGGGVFFCGIDEPLLTPDENGYLLHFTENKAILKRNSNPVSAVELSEQVHTVAVIKTGPVISVTVNEKEIIRYIDEIPFYSDFARLNRFGFIANANEQFSLVRISIRDSAFNYDRMREYRKPVRFKNDEQHYYEMQIFPGQHLDKIGNFLLMRELNELTRVEERLLSYKKDRDRALMRLANSEKGFHGLFGASPAIEAVINSIQAVAKTNVSVLITGETGTGKDVAATAVHAESGRKGPMIKLDCASLPVTLIESELFGHERGAFTGADHMKPGKFEQADNGTLFLDEIGNLSLEVQMKLLRFLQDRQFERLGGKKTLQSDVRIIAATNGNLEEEVRRGRFRADLYYRIKVVHINIPPLRERLMDMYPIIDNLIITIARQNDIPIPNIANDVFPALLHYNWPGNVRELKNAIENALVIHREQTITAAHFPEYMKNKLFETAGTETSGTQRGREPGVDTVDDRPGNRSFSDKRVFSEAYDRFYGKPHKLAAYFGCSYNTIKRYLAIYGLGVSRQVEIRKALESFSDNIFTFNDFKVKMRSAANTARKYLDELCKNGSVVKEYRGRRVYFKSSEDMRSAKMGQANG